MHSRELHSLLDPGSPMKRHEEVMRIMAETYPDQDFSLVDQIGKDVSRLFAGNYPGYRACNTKYHNFDHTSLVVLAAARLIDGAAQDGCELPVRTARLCLAATYFHDVGLIQTENENEGTGARFTVGHEDRSIAFMTEYFKQRNLPQADITDCEAMINCTILALDPRDLTFADPETRSAGFILGTADLLGQLAERSYLEKLLLLYQEFQEAGVPGFSSELELLKKTEQFYTNVANVRLKEQLDNSARFMPAHFAARHGLDSDPYMISIERNIEYISHLVSNCPDRLECYEQRLKRST